MDKITSLRDALDDPHLLGGLIDGPSWRYWRVLLIAAMGEPLDDTERALFREVTGRAAEPGAVVEELWSIIGRRGGKTRAISVLASYIAACVKYTGILAPGEEGILPVMAASVRQAEIALGYVAAIFTDPKRPLFHRLLKNQTAETVELHNRVTIEVRPASFKTIRGISAVAVIADEIAFWSSGETINPDVEILAAVRPALATTGGPLIAISSPHAKRGELWTNYRKHYGPAGNPSVLVANASSRLMNETLPAKVVERAYEQDAARAAAEYGGKFRDDIEDFISQSLLDAVVVKDRAELPPVSGVPYVAFADPGGGSGSDSFTMAIAHRQGEMIVLDRIDEVRPKYSPDAVVEEFSQVLKSYGLKEVFGDKYAGLWPTERFKAHGIEYKPAPMPKSDIYRTALPILTGGKCELLDNTRMISQFCLLERRVNRGGRDSIDHPAGQHDDVANSVGGALVMAEEAKPFEWTKQSLAGMSTLFAGLGSDYERMHFQGLW